MWVWVACSGTREPRRELGAPPLTNTFPDYPADVGIKDGAGKGILDLTPGIYISNSMEVVTTRCQRNFYIEKVSEAFKEGEGKASETHDGSGDV